MFFWQIYKLTHVPLAHKDPEVEIENETVVTLR